MNLRKIFFILFCSLVVAGLWSQSTSRDFQFVNIKEGISKVGIYSITQDHYGFVWFGTNGAGLYRFDGIDYKPYKFDDNDSSSINSNLIFSSYLDKNNNLWVGTEDGLNLYDRDLDRFRKVTIGNSERRNVSVLSINGDGNGSLYVGTQQFGLFKVDLDTNQAINVPSKESFGFGITDIKVDKNGNVFLATGIGLREVDREINEIVELKVDTASDNVKLNDPVQYMTIDSNGDLWTGTMSNGLRKYIFDNTGRLVIDALHFPISNKRILSMIQLPDTTLMVGTENDGLFHLNAQGALIKNYKFEKTDKNSIRSNSIWSLFMDNADRIWMGYYNSGAAISDNLYDKFKNIESIASNPNSLQTGSVTAIALDKKGKFWIGMDGGGIDIYTPETAKIDHINSLNGNLYSGLTSDHIQSVFIDSKENIWAGSWDNGFYILGKGQRAFKNVNMQNSKGKLLSNAILTFDEDHDGIIWIGTFYTGIYSFNPLTNELINYNSRQFVNNGITGSDVRKILVDKDNQIWLGTTNGLFKINKLSEGNFKVTSFEERMSENNNNKKSASHILSIFECSKGYIWIGTRGAGLCRYDKVKNEFTWFNKLSGFNEENVASIIESKDGNLWIGGNSGLTKLNVDSREVTNYDSSDGLLSNDFNFNSVLEVDDGTMYFGNYLGMDFFNPEDLKINTKLPSVYLTGLKLFNQKVEPGDSKSPLKKVMAETKNLEFSYKQSVFTIEYTGINYTRPEKNQYAYYLEGLEESWNFVGGARSATYTNLDYGDYVFKLKAANNDNVWNEEPLTLNITILPPWWRTNAAMTAYLVLFFISVYLLNWITQSRIKEKEAIKNERIQRAQEDKLNEKKIQFFTNISHEIRTPLTLILNPLQDIFQDSSLNIPHIVKERLNVIYKNTDRLYRLINELMDFRKLELDKLNIKVSEFDLVGFTKEAVSYFKEEALNRNIVLAIDADLPSFQVWADKSMLEKVIFNLLSNAFKVTPDSGAINVDILSPEDLVELPLIEDEEGTKVFEIRISDTGPGLEKHQIDKIFERFYQVDNLNKTYYGSTGIGLEVVQSFVHLHKGKIEVESSIGKGTTFRVLLPQGKGHFKKEEIVQEIVPTTKRKRKEAFVVEDSSKTDEEGDVLIVNPRSNTLLIVEDSNELRNYLKRELKSQYKILAASNGAEGLKVAKESLPDIILTDVIMPEMNGFEFCKRIKADVKTSHIPLLMLTAKTRVDDRIEGIGLGADAYMAKPFDMRLLKLRLSQLIQSRKLIFDKYFGEIKGDCGKEEVNSTDKKFMQKVLKYIGENMSDSDLSVELLASELNLSRSYLYRKIKTLTGQTVNEFLRKLRLQKAKQILELGNSNVSEVCYKVGFTSPSYFTQCFKAHFGFLPTEVEVKQE